MKRLTLMLTGLLFATPALALEGTYKGMAEFAGGNVGKCTPSVPMMTIAVEGTIAKVRVMNTGVFNMVAETGTIEPDGSIRMTWAYNTGVFSKLGLVKFEGMFTNDTFDGVTENNLCRWKWTLPKD